MFEKIKGYIELGLWNEQMVTNVYSKGAISKEEYEQLKGLFK